MKKCYVRVFGVYRRQNYTMIILDRPVGFDIVPCALYEITDEDNSVIAPIANGNTVRALRFIIPNNKDTYWVTKLTERHTIQVGITPIMSLPFAPTESDIILAYGNGIANILSYFTESNFTIPKMLYYENKSLNDCFELPLLANIMKDNFKVHITGRIDKQQKDTIRGNKNLKKTIKFTPAIDSIPKDINVYVSGASDRILKSLNRRGIQYTIVPARM